MDDRVSDANVQQGLSKSIPRGIVIVGADCSGKTNLFTRLTNNYQESLQYIKSIAGQVIDDGYPLGKNASKDSYIELNRQYIQVLNKGFREPRAFLSDRSLIDAYCYALVNTGLPRPHISEKFIAFLREQWLLELNFVDMYLHCIPEFSIEDDGKRVLDKGYQGKITDQFEKLLEEAEKTFGTKVMTVLGSPEERQRTAVAFIGRHTGLEIEKAD